MGSKMSKNHIEILHEYRKSIVEQFIKELVYKTKRTADELVTNGLLFTDFKYKVSFILDDGSKMSIKRAFYVRNEQEICVFTEHYGYIIFEVDNLVEIEERLI